MLIEVMMTDYVLVTGRDDSIERLFGSLVQGGASNSQGALVFLQSVCGLLQQGADQWSQGLGLWRMWEVVAQTLLATINTTNEVNQGDSLEYNFGGVLAVLLFPIQTQLPIKVYYYQSAYKSLSKLWKEIYHSFARLAALVTTAEANACMEDLCAKVMQAWVPEFESPMLLEFLSIVCQKCVDSIDFSGMAQVQHQLILSPSKWARRRQKPLGHLHSLVHLLTKVQEELNTHLGGTDLAKQLSCSLILIAHNLVDTYIHLFSHVTSNGVITHIFSAVAMAMGRLYGSSTHVSVKLFVPSFLTKLERLWQEVCGCITGRFNGQYDSDFLEALSPLLEATFVHSRRAIKNQTHTMWSTTFARAGTLNYPDKLKPVLSKVKEKTNLSLPGWVMQAVVVAETPSSEMSMGGESQVSQVPLLAPTVSPSKLMRGSMLHRSPSPKPSPVPSKSPVKTVAPKDAKNIFSSIWNKMAADSLKDEDFVVISSPSAKKKMVLTDHQREMMKEKRVLPAMYNNLDASQDVSLMAQFATENTQQSTQSLFASISSKCSENGDKTKAAPASTSEKNTEPSSLVTKAVGDALPTRNSTSDMKMPSTPTRSRRKSVRISELQHEPQEISPKRDKERIVGLSVLNHNERKSRLSSYEDKVKEDSIKQNSDNKVENVVEAENSEEDIVRSSLESDASPTKPDINVDKKSEDDKEDVPNLDAPFVMFRSKETITVSPKPFSLSQDGAKKEPRRISLRKIHSQNDMSSESAKPEEFGACDQKEEVKKVPRRVPLQKLSEPLNEEAKVNFPALSPAKPQKSNLEKWIVKQQKDVSTEENIKDKLRKSDIEFETSNNDNNKVQTESHTLVEDTQSPHKVLSAKRHSEREQDRSVAETPTKNETGPLPILRSVRKLFLDKESDEDKEEPIRIDSKKDKEEPTRIDSKKEKEVEPLPLQVYSALSQGFDIKKVSNTQKESNVHDSFGFSQLEEEACDNPLNKEKSQSLFAEDEIKSINNQEDEIMSPEFKSTLASQPPIFRFKTYSKSSSSEDSERLTESETNTISSSAEPDFNPALPTMDIDGAKSTPNKRKRQTPKKYSPEKRLRRASVKHNTPHTEIEIQNKDVVTVEEDETSTAFIEIKVVEPSPKKQAPTSLENKAEEKLVSSAERERLLTASSKEDSLLTASSKKESKFNSVSEPEIEQLTPGKSIEDSQEMTKLKKSKESPEIIGEITPDMKSPSNATPSRRYSQAKRLRNSKLKCHSEPKRILHKKREAKKTSLDFGINGNSDNEMISDSNNTSVLSSLGKDQSPIKKIKKMSPMSVGRKPRHMLKSRVKGKRSLSSLSPSSSPPPNKLRKLTVDSQSENSEEVVKKKRGRPKKQPKTNISFSEDDDVPLSQLSSKEKEINVLEEVVEEPTKLVNESEKVVKESTTVVNETEVAVKQSTTVVNETEVVVKESTTVVNETEVAVKESTTVVNETEVAVKESTTVVNETEAAVNEAETAVNQHSSEEEDDSVPLIKLLVKPQKLSVKSQENKGDKKVDKVSNDEIKDVYIDEAKLDSTNDKCNTESQVPLFMSESDDVFTEDMPPAAQQIMSPEVSGTSSSSSNSSGQTEGSGAASSDQLQASSTDIVMSGSEVNHLHLSMSNQTPQDQEDMDTESTCPPSASDLFLSLSKQTEEEENNLSESKKDKPLSESSIEEKSIGLTSAVEETSTSISSKNELNSNSLSLKTFNAPEIVGEKAANESKDISNTSNETAMEVENSSEGVVLSAVPPETSQALHDWSPGKSPSSSILKKTVIATPPSAKSNRVSFADPVVSGESPLREKYHSEQFSSPSCHLSSPGSRKRSSFGRSVSKRRLESSLRKESGLTRTHIARSPAPSPTPSPLSQSLKATPESQLDTVKPVYPSLVGCVTPLDSVLPQLTTSLWYRGLRQMMKGRNLHTVGDLSALTEVQVNQLPFRAPKVDTVRAALGTFMLQQGMKQGQGVLDELDPKDAKEKEESLPEIKEHNPLEVTSDSVASPANIADEGLRVRASDDAMLQSLSPIKVKNVLHRFVLLKAAESSPSPRKQLVFDAAEGNALTNHLTSLGQSGEALGLKDLDMGELMDLHTSINSLFSVVVDEMKSRCKPST